MVDRIAKKYGLPVHETPIGFKHICTKFLEVKPLIGGEESGGIGIPSHVYERDGLLSGLLLLEIMSVKKKRLGELLKDLTQEIGPFYFEREDIHLSPEELDQIRENLGRKEISKIGPLKVAQVNRLDGLKFLLEDDSWLLIRVSGTEPLVRLYAEASDPTLVKNLIREARMLLRLS
jgi:phosphomannomutase